MDPNSACPLCGTPAYRQHMFDTHQRFFACEICGRFLLDSLSERLIEAGLEPTHRALVRHWLLGARRDVDDAPLIGAETLKHFERQPLPPVSEQIDNLVRWLGDNSPFPGADVTLHPLLGTAVAPTPTAEGFLYLADYVSESGLLSGYQKTLGVRPLRGKLTVLGWSRYSEMKLEGATTNHVFMAMPYGVAALDAVVRDHFAPAVARTGLRLVRLDDPERQKAGLIDSRLLMEIRNSVMVIADLTHENRGAYWEAGYAEGLGRPVLYTRQKQGSAGERVHFDTDHMLRVEYDLGDLETAAAKIKAIIRVTLPHLTKSIDD